MVEEYDGIKFHPSWGEAGGTTKLLVKLIKEIKGLRRDVRNMKASSTGGKR